MAAELSQAARPPSAVSPGGLSCLGPWLRSQTVWFVKVIHCTGVQLHVSSLGCILKHKFSAKTAIVEVVAMLL